MVFCVPMIRCWRSLWENLSKGFRPSEDDLADHTPLISETIKRDETLIKATFFESSFDEKLQKKKAFDEDMGNTKPGSIIDDDVIAEMEDDGFNDEENLFDTVCAICENGGVFICCEGRCTRSFHATVEAGAESMCESLGLSDEQVESFVCKNCQYKQHQCFVCGELGSSDISTGAEVFSCVSATCGYFYHPHCVAKLLHRDNANEEAEELQKKIADREPFTCPIHKCFLCKLGEDKTDPQLQFAVCRCCPKSFHRKCLPREIGVEDGKEIGITQRHGKVLFPIAS